MPGRMKSIIQKGIIPTGTQFQDNKFQTSRHCEVRSRRVINGELFLASYFKTSYFGELFLCKLDDL